MWKVLTAVLAWTALARAEPPGLTRPHTGTAEVAKRFADAATRGDIAGVTAFLQQPVGFGGLWFPDLDCRKKFNGAGEVPVKGLDEFAKCLAKLPFQISPRLGAYADGVVLTYAPGFEVEARFFHDNDFVMLRTIGYTARRDLSDGLPTVTPETLEALRTAGTRKVELDPASRATLDAELRKSALDHAYSSLKICVDAHGKVSGAHGRESSSAAAESAFAAAIKDWAFKPFVAAGAATPVCAVERFVYPADRAPSDERLPPSDVVAKVIANEPPVLPPNVLQRYRISGDIHIEPDDATKTDIQRAGGQAMASFRLCIDELGHIASIDMSRSSGFHDYDTKLVSGMRSWAYRPYLVDGTPTAVCTPVVFIYSQR